MLLLNDILIRSNNERRKKKEENKVFINLNINIL